MVEETTVHAFGLWLLIDLRRVLALLGVRTFLFWRAVAGLVFPSSTLFLDPDRLSCRGCRVRTTQVYCTMWFLKRGLTAFFRITLDKSHNVE